MPVLRPLTYRNFSWSDNTMVHGEHIHGVTTMLSLDTPDPLWLQA